MNNSEYFSTDLAEETYTRKKEHLINVSAKKEIIEKITVSEIEITTPEEELILKKPKGKYITLFFDKIGCFEEKDFNNAISVLSLKISGLISNHLKNQNGSVLIIGLGNRYITADSIGPLSAEGITVSKRISGWSIAAIIPGVTGQTGIETSELVKGAVDRLKPDLVIAVDALVSGSIDRLASTIQLSNTGIIPGSGIGRKKSEITEKSLGIPVISIGTPTMVNSSTLVYDALKQSGIKTIGKNLKNVLENGKSYFVTLNDSDRIVRLLAGIISQAIDKTFS